MYISRRRVEDEEEVDDENEVEEKSKQKLNLYFGFGFFSYPPDTIQSFCSRDSSRTKVHFVSNVKRTTNLFCFNCGQKEKFVILNAKIFVKLIEKNSWKNCGKKFQVSVFFWLKIAAQESSVVWFTSSQCMA